MALLMKISEAATLALHAMVYLAANPGRMISTGEMAERLNVSEAHLSKVMQRLTKAGYLKSIRGPKGGFMLDRGGDSISLLDIYEVIEGPVTQDKCLLGSPVCTGAICILCDLVEKVNYEAKDYLASTTLSSLTGTFDRQNAE